MRHTRPKSRWFAEGPEFREQVARDFQIRKIVRRCLPYATTCVRIERVQTLVIVTAEVTDLVGAQRAQIVQDTICDSVEPVLLYVILGHTTASAVAARLSRRVDRSRSNTRRALDREAERLSQQTFGGYRLEVRRPHSKHIRTAGRVPLQTISADIDYAQETAQTTYGAAGVHVWITNSA